MRLRSRSFVLDSAAVLVLLTGILYGLALIYDTEEMRFYGLPLVGVRVASLVHVGSEFGGLATLALLASLITRFVGTLFMRGLPFPFALEIAIVCNVILGFFVLHMGYDWKLLAAFAPPLALLIVTLASPIRSKGSYREALSNLKWHHLLDMSPSSKLRSRRFMTAFAVVYVLFVLAVMSAQMGRSSASHRVDYLATNADPVCVVIRTYDNGFICAEYRGRKPLLNFRALPMTDNLLVSRRALGPLEAAPRHVHWLEGFFGQ